MIRDRFAIAVSPVYGAIGEALTRGFDGEWFRLLDVSPVPNCDGVFRIFALTDAGKLRKAVLERQFGAGRIPS
jgi:hypothetical protein